MVRYFPVDGRSHYGPDSPRKRHDDCGSPWSDTASQESLTALAERYGANQKTVAKLEKRTSVIDLSTSPSEPKSSVLSSDEEAIIVAFRRHTPPPLDDFLYSLQGRSRT